MFVRILSIELSYNVELIYSQPIYKNSNNSINEIEARIMFKQLLLKSKLNNLLFYWVTRNLFILKVHIILSQL